MYISPTYLSHATWYNARAFFHFQYFFHFLGVFLWGGGVFIVFLGFMVFPSFCKATWKWFRIVRVILTLFEAFRLVFLCLTSLLGMNLFVWCWSTYASRYRLNLGPLSLLSSSFFLVKILIPKWFSWSLMQVFLPRDVFSHFRAI